MTRPGSEAVVAAVLGWPIGHTLSPAMHNAALGAAKLPGRYAAFAVAPENLPAALSGLPALGLCGCNLTVPHKEAALPQMHTLSDEARLIGAVNTVSFVDGARHGDNTDARGLVRALEEAGLTLTGRRVLVIGGGGAAKAAVVGLARAGAAEVRVATRRPAQAEALTTALSAQLPAGLGALSLTDQPALRQACAGSDLLVQATSATLQPDSAAALATQLPLDAMPAGAAVVDLVYRPRQTAVLAKARAAGLVAVDGLGMLLHQGALAFERW
ncbi:MAG: shikimate dehydrogenase family protein, partial [Polyangiales bacterium]